MMATSYLFPLFGAVPIAVPATVAQRLGLRSAQAMSRKQFDAVREAMGASPSCPRPVPDVPHSWTRNDG